MKDKFTKLRIKYECGIRNEDLKVKINLAFANSACGFHIRKDAADSTLEKMLKLQFSNDHVLLGFLGLEYKNLQIFRF